MILHITAKADWERAKELGTYTSPSLESEGFIHCSTETQAVESANLFFKGHSALLLLRIDESKLESECRYEAPSHQGVHDPAHGILFPHIYGPINISAVAGVYDFRRDDKGLFTLPPELSE